MNNTVNIPISDLQSKRKKLEIQVEDIKAELAHIDWVLANYVDSSMKEGTIKPMTIGGQIQQILLDAKPKALSAKQIWDELKKQGQTMQLSTLHAHMSRLTKSSKYSIKRPEYGLYSI